VILTLVHKDIRDAVLDSIYRGAKLEKPNHGIAFVLDVEKVVGICHVEKTRHGKAEKNKKSFLAKRMFCFRRLKEGSVQECPFH
jgi:hypothetical protein